MATCFYSALQSNDLAELLKLCGFGDELRKVIIVVEANEPVKFYNEGFVKHEACLDLLSGLNRKLKEAEKRAPSAYSSTST